MLTRPVMGERFAVTHNSAVLDVDSIETLEPVHPVTSEALFTRSSKKGLAELSLRPLDVQKYAFFCDGAVTLILQSVRGVEENTVTLPREAIRPIHWHSEGLPRTALQQGVQQYKHKLAAIREHTCSKLASKDVPRLHSGVCWPVGAL